MAVMLALMLMLLLLESKRISDTPMLILPVKVVVLLLAPLINSTTFDESAMSLVRVQ